MTVTSRPKDRRPPEARSFDAALGAKVKALRLGERISQTELGDRLGISFQQVQKYEMGRDRVTAYTLQRIATLFGVPVSTFFENLPMPSGTTPDLREAMRAVAAIQRISDPKLRRHLLALIRELAGAAVEKVEP